MTSMSSTQHPLIRVADPVQGWVAPGLEPVVDAFAKNLDDGLELGAAFAAYRAGDCLVDIWGGYADANRTRSWNFNTACPVFSGTKGMVAVCLALLIDRGQLDLDRSVMSYWPEFGKPEIAVRDVVSHTSRIPGIAQPVTLEEFLDDARMAEVVASEQPNEDPRALLCYHPFTFGWICAELIRRIDGRTLGDFFQDEVAEPLGLQLWIGLPIEYEPRVAAITLAKSWMESPFLQPDAYESDPFQFSIWANPKVLTPDSFVWNERRVHAVGNPAAGAIGTARAMARMYDSLPKLVSQEVIELASTPLSEGVFGPIGEERRFGVGFQLANGEHSLGPTDAVIGHTGAGGSLHGRWLTYELGFSYVTNQLRGADDVQRGESLLAALHHAIR